MSSKTGNWTTSEDSKLKEIVETKRIIKWSAVATKLNRLNIAAQKRTSSECRQRWINYLDPAINPEKWTPQQERQLFDLHAKFGNSWTLISRQIPGRPSIVVKNHFYAALRKGLRKLNKQIRKAFKQSVMKPIPKRFVSKVLCMMSPKQKVLKFASVRHYCVELVSSILKFSRFEGGKQLIIKELEKVIEVSKVLNPIIHQHSRTVLLSDQEDNEVEVEQIEQKSLEQKPIHQQPKVQEEQIKQTPKLGWQAMSSTAPNFMHSGLPWLPYDQTPIVDQSQYPMNSMGPLPIINWMTGPITYLQNQYWYNFLSERQHL